MIDAINTHGLKPNPQPQFKLFEVDGFQLLMTLDGNEDGEGYGIRYTVPLDIPGLLPVSIWIGVNRDDGGEISPEVVETWNAIFNDTDQEGARKALQQVFEQAGPTLKKLIEAQEEG